MVFTIKDRGSSSSVPWNHDQLSWVSAMIRPGRVPKVGVKRPPCGDMIGIQDIICPCDRIWYIYILNYILYILNIYIYTCPKIGDGPKIITDKGTCLSKGEGCQVFSSQSVTPGVALRMHYVGTFKDNGQVFDSSERAGQPIRFPVGRGQVIRGWDEGAARRWRLRRKQ